jgi:branched-chain amino acid transport system substrate-binding protein
LVLGIACTALIGLTATACGSSASGGGISGGSGGIVFGGLFDETGAASVLGTNELQGAQAAIKAVNAVGGVLGRKIKFDVKDTASDPQQAVQVARDLVADHAAVVIGPTTSASGFAALPVLTAAHVPSLNTAGLSTYPQVTDKTYVFDVLPSTPVQTKAVFKYWQATGVKRVTMIGAATASLEQLQQLFAPSVLKQYGVTLLKTVSYPPGTADLTASLTTVAGTHPQFVYAASFGSDEIALFKQIHSIAGLATTPIMGNPGTIAPALLKPLSAAQTANLYSPVWRTVVVNSLTGQQKTQAEAYLKGMQAAGYTPDPTSTAVGGWEAVMLAVDAIKKAASTDGVKLQTIMQTQSYVGAVADWHKTPGNHMGASPSDLPIARWENEAWTVAKG